MAKSPPKMAENQISRGLGGHMIGRSADWWTGIAPYKLQSKYHRLTTKIGSSSSKSYPPKKTCFFFFGRGVEFSIVDNATFDLAWYLFFSFKAANRRTSFDELIQYNREMTERQVIFKDRFQNVEPGEKLFLPQRF